MLSRHPVDARPKRWTVTGMMLLTPPRTESVAALLTLPEGTAIHAHFPDDGSTRDLTAFAPTLLLEFLLRDVSGSRPGAAAEQELVEVAQVSLTGAEWSECRLALIDTQTHAISEVPNDQLPSLLAGAFSMAVTEAAQAAVASGAADTAAGGPTPHEVPSA